MIDLAGRLLGSLFPPWVRMRWLSRFLTPSMLAIVDQGCVSAIGFLTTILLARFGQSGELANYVLALSTVILVRAIQERLISTPYTVFWSKFSGQELRNFTGNSVGQITLLCGLFAILLVAARLILHVHSDYTGILSVLVWAGPAMVFREYVRQYYFARDRIWQVTVMDSLTTLAQIVLILTFIHYDNLSAQSVYFALGLPCLMAGITFAILNASEIGLRFVPRYRYSMMTWRFGRWLLAGRLVGTVGTQMMPWLLVFLADKVAVEQLAVCASLTGLSLIFLTGWNNYLRPQSIRVFADGAYVGLREYWFASSSRLAIALGLLCLVYALFADQLIKLLFNVTFESMNAVAVLLGLHVLCSGLSMLCGNALGALERSTPNFWGEVASATMMLATATVLIPIFGVLGAAAAILAGAVAGLAVMWIALEYELRPTQPSVPHSSSTANDLAPDPHSLVDH